MVLELDLVEYKVGRKFKCKVLDYFEGLVLL